MSKGDWVRSPLERVGFVGWVPWSSCPASLTVIDRRSGGVYVIYRAGPLEPRYLDGSPGGRFRGDPSVSQEVLKANWVPGARVIYIGKGKHGRLRKRLEEFVGFGRGGEHRHWGGRLIWQLDRSEELLVAWRTLPAEIDPAVVEKEMIVAFRADYGKPPYANDPHRLGH
jgi:hypothetical protein